MSNKFNLKEMYEKIPNNEEITFLNNENILHMVLYCEQISGHKLPQISREGLLNLDRNKINDNWNYVLQAISNYNDWAQFEKIFDSIFPVAFINFMIGVEAAQIKTKKKSIFKDPKIKTDIKKFMLAKMLDFNSPYNKSYIANDYKKIQEYLNSEKFDVFINYIQLNPIEAHNILLTGRKGGNKEKIYLIGMTLSHQEINKDINNDNLKNINKGEVHHIIPKAVCKKFNINTEQMNSLANLIIITPTTNKTHAMDKLPSIYFNEFFKNHGNLGLFNQYNLMGISQNIDENFKDYEKFIKKRANDLAKLINEYLKDFYKK